MVNVLKKTSALSCTLYLMTGHRFLAYHAAPQIWASAQQPQAKMLEATNSIVPTMQQYSIIMGRHASTRRFGSTFLCLVPVKRTCCFSFLTVHLSTVRRKCLDLATFPSLRLLRRQAPCPVGRHSHCDYLHAHIDNGVDGQGRNEWQA